MILVALLARLCTPLGDFADAQDSAWSALLDEDDAT